MGQGSGSSDFLSHHFMKNHTRSMAKHKKIRSDQGCRLPKKDNLIL